jgi:hypothetical protein
MPVEGSFKINLDQNLCGLLVAYAALGIATLRKDPLLGLGFDSDFRE